MTLYELLSHLIIPAVILILALVYKSIIENFVTTAKTIKLNIAGLGTINITAKEASDELSELYSEFYLTYNRLLKDHERALFTEVKNKIDQGEVPAVKDFFPDFNRQDSDWRKTKEGSRALGTLRALRGIGLIAPSGHQCWEADSKISVTRLGKVVTDRFKNEL